KYNALPDPKSRAWGFLMDLCGAMGIGANLVRPELANDLWSGHELIFETLGFDEIATHFISRELNLNEFFIAAGISYNSTIPVGEYLSLFDRVDKERIFSIYASL